MSPVLPATLMLALSVAPAAAQVRPAGEVRPDVKAAEARDPNRMICTMVGETGTRLGSKRVCRSAAEWEEERRQTRNNVDGLRNNRQVNGPR